MKDLSNVINQFYLVNSYRIDTQKKAEYTLFIGHMEYFQDIYILGHETNLIKNKKKISSKCIFLHLCKIKSEISNIDTWEIYNIWKQINTF